MEGARPSPAASTLSRWCSGAAKARRVEVELTTTSLPPPRVRARAASRRRSRSSDGPPDRPVSSQVSMHADLVTYDVRNSDGANAGLNPPQTVPPGSDEEYTWDTHRPEDADGNGRAARPRAAPGHGRLPQPPPPRSRRRTGGPAGGATPYEVTPGKATADRARKRSGTGPG